MFKKKGKNNDVEEGYIEATQPKLERSDSNLLDSRR